MRAVIGAILILAASVLVAAGIIAEAVSQGRYGTPGYVLGVLIGIVGLVALDEMLSVGGDRGESLTLGDTIADGGEGPVQAYEVEEMRHILADAINRLPEREKTVLTLYYYEGLTLAEIGSILVVTESRICQIHTKAVIQLLSPR